MDDFEPLPEKELQELRISELNEKDRFILSDANQFESPEKIANLKKTSKDIKLPSRYTIVDRVQRWGVDVKDPLAVRTLE